MLTVALVMAIIGLAALVTAIVTSNQIIAWVSLAAGAIGVVLLIVDWVRARRQRDAQSAPPVDELIAFDADYPDDRPSVDAPIHAGDHAAQREIIREERVLHHDTGFLDPDMTKEEVAEVFHHRHRHRAEEVRSPQENRVQVTGVEPTPPR